MDGELILGAIIMTLCGFGCGALFLGIGIWAKRSEKPIHFYSGTTMDPESISDVRAYNMENSRMWKLYSLPYFLSGFCGILTFVDIRFSYVSTAAIILASTAGVVWLVLRYHRILNTYKVR